jgi:hypothetical protein
MDLQSRLFKYSLYVPFLSFNLRLIINYQGSTTRERHLIASGTNDKIPDIYVWEKQVGSNIYISENRLSDFQRERDILHGGDEVTGVT